MHCIALPSHLLLSVVAALRTVQMSIQHRRFASKASSTMPVVNLFQASVELCRLLEWLLSVPSQKVGGYEGSHQVVKHTEFSSQSNIDVL